MALKTPEDAHTSGDGSSLGIDNICLNIDKYLEDLEKSMDIKNATLRRSSSFGYPSTSASDEKNWSTASKKSLRRHSLDNDLDKKEEMNTSQMETTDPESKSLQLIWRNLCYLTKAKSWTSGLSSFCRQNVQKVILDRQSGEICGGQLTAIIGPSGAGKSTLLESLAGRRSKGLKGEVLVVYDNDYVEKGETVKISFIGQKDYVLEVLTVRETLLFATQIKNYHRIENRYFHQRLVKSVLKELSLEICADVRVSKISGGQLKRLCFGVELISGPDILLLDEPTSGLDSSSAFQCVLLLRKLTDLRNKEFTYKPPAIICSIHQPSARVLNIFHQVYVLSHDGRCLYQGSPYALLTHLSKFNLYCPQFHNPADYIIEIASGDYGHDPINKLAIAESNRQMDLLNDEKMILSCKKFVLTTTPKPGTHRVPVKKIVNKLKNQRFPYFLHTWLLLKRTYLSTIREPKLTWFRISQALFIALLMSYLYNYPIGEADGCVPLGASDNSENQFIVQALSGTQDNIAFIFFITLFTVMACMMPTVLTFPTEVSVLVQERNNGWYSCWTYYWTKVLADSPYQIFITIMFCSIIYPMTGQIQSMWRFWMFNLINILVASIAQCVGMLFGTVYVKSVQNAVFMAPLSMAPVFLMSGFFGKISAIPLAMKPIAIISYVKYAFESLLVILYGFDRCPPAFGKSGANFPNLMPGTIDEYHASPPAASDKISPNEILEKVPRYALDFPKVWSGYYNPLTYPLNASALVDNEEAKANVVSTSSSLILNRFEVKDETLWQNIVILVFILTVLRFLAYFILLMKTNERK